MAQENGTIAERARRYSSLKYALAIIQTLYSAGLLLLFAASGGSKSLALALERLLSYGYLVLPSYLLLFALGYSLANFPLDFYSSYILEHRFGLSRQKISDWLFDQGKGWLLQYLIGLILLSLFYYLAARYSRQWWWIVSFIWIFFNLFLAKLTPVLIIPLFFKYRRLSDEQLKERIINLAAKMGIKFLDVFEIDFSRKTLKANAAFVGMGRTKRVILADTLKDKYSPDEIEVILAHEFAHYRQRHLVKLVMVNSLATIAAFYLIFKTSAYLFGFFGLVSLSDIAGLPLVLLYIVAFGILTGPLGNYISRKLEREADRMAIEATGLREAFILTMEKLAAQNLADRNPHPLIKFFFFNHPPIDERIASANSVKL